METLIPAFLRRQRNQRHLTPEMLFAQAGISPQHLSEIESGKRDPRLSSIKRMAEAMVMTVLVVPDAMTPDLRRYVADNGRIYIFHAGQAAAAPTHPEEHKTDHAQEKTCPPTQPSVPSSEFSSLSFIIETFDDRKPANPPSTAVSAATGRTKKPWMC